MTKIEWANRTWNPVTGCTRVSEGCDHCYMHRMYPRLKGFGTPGYSLEPDMIEQMPDRLVPFPFEYALYRISASPVVIPAQSGIQS